MFAGSLGPVIFRVSHSQIRTFKNLTRKRAAKSARHDVIEGLPRLQHTGRDLDEITLTVVLERMHSFDSTPDACIRALLAMADAGDEVPLLLGLRYSGLWYVRDVSPSHTVIHRGATWRAEVALTLVEYDLTPSPDAFSVAASAALGNVVGEAASQAGGLLGGLAGDLAASAGGALSALESVTGIASGLEGIVAEGVSGLEGLIGDGLSGLTAFVTDGVLSLNGLVTDGLMDCNALVSGGVLDLGSFIPPGIADVNALVATGGLDLDGLVSGGLLDLTHLATSNVLNIADLAAQGQLTMSTLVAQGVADLNGVIAQGTDVVASLAGYLGSGVPSDLATFFTTNDDGVYAEAARQV